MPALLGFQSPVSAVVDSRSVLGFTGMGEEIGGLGRQGSQETSLWPLRGYYLRK